MDILNSRKLPLKLMLNPPPTGDIISFDIVEREDRSCLEQGSKFQACYLGESESGRNSIDLPLHPQAGAPCYFLTPPLHGDAFGVGIKDDRIEVFREKLDQKKATARNNSFDQKLRVPQGSYLFIPDDPAYSKNFSGNVSRYHCDPEIGLTRGKAPKDPNAPDVLFWGQRISGPMGEHWFFSLQEHLTKNQIHIKNIFFIDGRVWGVNMII